MKTHAAIAAVCARFSGLFMIASSLPEVGHAMGRIFKHFMAIGDGLNFLSPNVDYYDADISNYLGWLLLLLLGLYLLFGGHLITRLLVRPLLANCQSCGYPLASIHATRCPECGHDNPKPQ